MAVYPDDCHPLLLVHTVSTPYAHTPLSAVTGALAAALRHSSKRPVTAYLSPRATVGRHCNARRRVPTLQFARQVEVGQADPTQRVTGKIGLAVDSAMIRALPAPIANVFNPTVLGVNIGSYLDTKQLCTVFCRHFVNLNELQSEHYSVDQF